MKNNSFLCLILYVILCIITNIIMFEYLFITIHHAYIWLVGWIECTIWDIIKIIYFKK
jgi:hypothetical protein